MNRGKGRALHWGGRQREGGKTRRESEISKGKGWRSVRPRTKNQQHEPKKGERRSNRLRKEKAKTQEKGGNKFLVGEGDDFKAAKPIPLTTGWKVGGKE